MLPNPPNTAAGNAFKPINPIEVSIRLTGASRIPAIAATEALIHQIIENILLTGLPM